MKLFTIVLCLFLVFITGAIGCGSDETSPTPTAIPVSTPTATPAPTPAGLFLEILEPGNESVVITGTIVLRGITIVNAVVSVTVDGSMEIASVDEDGSFSMTVTLVEGPNLIEVITSDSEGNEESKIITIIYNPQS